MSTSVSIATRGNGRLALPLKICVKRHKENPIPNRVSEV